jgi:hypothetical protein
VKFSEVVWSGVWSDVKFIEVEWSVWSDVEFSEVEWSGVCVVMWSELTWFMWSDFVFEVQWCEVSYGEILLDKSAMYIRVTL